MGHCSSTVYAARVGLSPGELQTAPLLLSCHSRALCNEDTDLDKPLQHLSRSRVLLCSVHSVQQVCQRTHELRAVQEPVDQLLAACSFAAVSFRRDYIARCFLHLPWTPRFPSPLRSEVQEIMAFNNSIMSKIFDKCRVHSERLLQAHTELAPCTLSKGLAV